MTHSRSYSVSILAGLLLLVASRTEAVEAVARHVATSAITTDEIKQYVGTLADELAEPIVKVSHHLGVLRHADLVKTTKKGRFVEYALHPEVFLVTDPANENLIDLGCCRLDLGEPNDNPKKRRS